MNKSNITVLKQYLLNNNFFMKRGDDRKFTHLLLDGGKLFIPPEKRNDFLKFYSSRLEINDDKLYVIETRTDIFKFFLDLDLFNKLSISEDNIKNIITIIQKGLFEILKKNHSSHESRIIVCLTSNKEVEKAGSIWVKTGIHVYWPEVYVNKETALMLRNVIVSELHKHGGTRPTINPWEDVVDRCVFTENGIRMIGSRNKKSCKYCKSKNIDTKTCEKCKGSGKIDEGRAYKPVMIMDGKCSDLKKHVTKLLENKEKMVKEISIQTDYTELPKEIEIPEEYRDITTNKKQQKITKFTTGNKNIFDLGDEEKEGEKQNINLDDTKLKKLTKFITSVMPSVYNGIKIVGILRLQKKNTVSYIIRTNSKFCMNLNDNHNSNGIYFYIDKNYIYQKCWCRCINLAGRSYGYCKDYKSEGRPLDLYIQKLLFPEEKGKIKTTLHVPPISNLKNNDKYKKKEYMESLDMFNDQILSNLIKKKSYEDEIVGKKMRLKL